MIRVLCIILCTLISLKCYANARGPEQDEAIEESPDFFIPQIPAAPKQDKSLFDFFFGDENQKPLIDESEPQDDGLDLIGEKEREGKYFPIAQVRVIDKTLGVLYEKNLDVGQSTKVRELYIKPISCWKPNTKTLRSEARALLEIYYQEHPSPPQKAFYGWMFADAQALNPLSHPKYDVTIADCIDKIETEKSTE